MRVWLVIAVLCAAAQDGGSRAPKIPFTGELVRETVTRPCAGGARITEEMIQREVTPLARVDLTFLEGNRSGKVVARATTDSKARFTAQLPEGVYCVVLGRAEPYVEPPVRAATRSSTAIAPAALGEIDEQCMADLEKPKCDTQFTMWPNPRDPMRVIVYLTNQCPQAWAHPCYRGPPPP
jgi:hypothetical protein